MANKNTRLDLDDEQTTDGPVECLGMTFPSDEARREHFLEILREKLQDPDFRSIEGFPIGEDEDILALSDPPYYTACPNPFIEDFIEHYGTPYDAETDEYHREPFAADVSEGRNNVIYNAHTYPTKVPHRAIMRYLLHYTEPGDLVFDGFCGAGMTGVAAQLCEDKDELTKLGLRVGDTGSLIDDDGNAVFQAGTRVTVQNDLSTLASFIAYSLNAPVDSDGYERDALDVLEAWRCECDWMFLTLHQPTGNDVEGAVNGLEQFGANIKEEMSNLPWAEIEYVVWSDVFICPECSDDIVFWEAAMDPATGRVTKAIECPHCGAELTKLDMDRKMTAFPDEVLGETLLQAVQKPVFLTYAFGGETYTKELDEFDVALIGRTDKELSPYWFPTDELPEGYNTRQPKRSHGFTHVHHFYTHRMLRALSALFERIDGNTRLKFLFTSQLNNLSVMNRYRPEVSFPYNPLSGTLYVGSVTCEANPFKAYENKATRQARALRFHGNAYAVECCSSTQSLLPDKCVDYVFTDPPFGGNLMYSEINFLLEAWLRVLTNNKPEAITNDVQRKSLAEYQALMTRCFQEYNRVLKPGRWMTVEFHNSKNSVWRAIQEGLQRAGFVIADVRTLDKQQGSFKQVTSASAVKQDLIISAYKPNGGLEKRFQLDSGTESGVWDFIRTHLRQLAQPFAGGKIEVLAERQDYLLYDRMVAFHVERGVTVPMSAAEFYAGLRQRFPERDAMFFLPEQVSEYDSNRMQTEEVQQPQLIITDESSAIQWLRQLLRAKPQTFQDLQPQFMQQLQVWDAHEQQLELSDILKENFLRYDDDGEVPSQIHSYLSSNYHSLRNLEKDDPALVEKAKDRWYVPDPSKEADLEKIRHRALMREFEEYRESKGKLKTVRTEALRAGFKECWQNGDYQTIVDVAERLPDEVVQEDSALLMYYDNALMRTEG
jgi:DNA modification methylase